MLQPVFREHPLADVHRFGDPVGIEEQQIARRHGAFVLLVDHPFHGADNRPVQPVQPLQVAVPAFEIGRIVSGVGVDELAGPDVHDADEQGHEHAVLVVDAELVVEVRDDAGGRTIVGRARFDQRLRHRHEQGRRHALARYVADAEADAVLVDEVEVVEITRHLAGRLQHRENGELVVIGEGRKDER